MNKLAWFWLLTALGLTPSPAQPDPLPETFTNRILVTELLDRYPLLLSSVWRLHDTKGLAGAVYTQLVDVGLLPETGAN